MLHCRFEHGPDKLARALVARDAAAEARARQKEGGYGDLARRYSQDESQRHSQSTEKGGARLSQAEHEVSR